jgi:hypothetical protein
MTKTRTIFIFLLSLCLLFGMSACTAPDETATEPIDEIAESQQPTAELPKIDSDQFFTGYKGDPNHATFAPQVESMSLELDFERQIATIIVATPLANVEEGCALGEDIALYLSEHATVTRADGTIVDDNTTPYGALYSVWSLNILINGEGSPEPLVLDGWLPARTGALTWQ